METATPFGIAALVSIAASGAFCDPVARPGGAATRPNGWDSAWLKYDSSAMAVEETTPTAAQVDFWKRPPALKADASAPTTTPSAKPLQVGPVDIVRLRFRDTKGEDVPM